MTFHMGNEWACDSDSDSTFHTWLQLWSCICLNSLPTKYCLYLLKLISIFGHFLTVNNRRYGRCCVKIFIPPCTFLEFYTQLGAKIVSKCFLQVFKGFRYYVSKNIVFLMNVVIFQPIEPPEHPILSHSIFISPLHPYLPQCRGSIKGWTPGKLPGFEDDFAHRFDNNQSILFSESDTYQQSWQTCDTHFRIELKFGVLGFLEGGKPENLEKNPRSRDKNEQTQTTCDCKSRNQTQAQQWEVSPLTTARSLLHPSLI